MKEYLSLCLQGKETIQVRQELLKRKQDQLRDTIKELQDSIDYIDWKQNLYNDILSGKKDYESNLIPNSIE